MSNIELDQPTLEKILQDMKVGEAVEVSSPWPGLGEEQVLLICTSDNKQEKKFAASYYGIEIGPMKAVYDRNNRLVFPEETEV